jgi:hypothetical protein
MELFHTVPDSLLSPYVNFDFLADNSLVVSSKYDYKIGSIVNLGIECNS